MSERSIAVIGLGLLGGAIAARLCELGWPVRGFDVDSARRDAAQAEGVKTFDSAAAAIDGATRILLSLPNSDVVGAVLNELKPALCSDSVILDTTTGDPNFAVAQAETLCRAGVTYLETNVVGSSAQARAGDVTLLVAGDSATIDRCRDLFDALAARWFAVGPTGAAARMKLVANLVLGLNRAALAEGLSFAEKLDLSPALTLEVLQASAAYSRAMDTKGQKMLDRDFSPQARLAQHLKDVRLMIAAAEKSGADLPLTRVHEELLEESVQAGRGPLDNSAIIEVFRDRAT